EAYDEFARGYAASGRPAFLFNMAEAARAMGEVEKARADYERYLREDPDGQYAALAARRLAELPAPPPPPPPPPVERKPVPRAEPTVIIPPPAQAARAREAKATPAALTATEREQQPGLAR